jgi:hypothetical protein
MVAGEPPSSGEHLQWTNPAIPAMSTRTITNIAAFLSIPLTIKKWEEGF